MYFADSIVDRRRRREDRGGFVVSSDVRREPWVKLLT
jgi:hypothetical protein